MELNPDRFLGDALAIIERVRAQRVVFDSISTIALGVGSERRFRELHYALASHLRETNVPNLVTSEYGADANGSREAVLRLGITPAPNSRFWRTSW